jgi:hypothetical protein
MSLDSTTEETLEEGFDFRQPLSLFWHWWWLIVLVTVMTGAAAYFISKQMTPSYQSSTTVLVNEAPATKTTDYSSVMMSEQLTSTYAQMMAKDPVLYEVMPFGADDDYERGGEADHGDAGEGYAADRSDGGDDGPAAFGKHSQRGGERVCGADPADPEPTVRAEQGDAGGAAGGDGEADRGV